jgi:hypothetical protein
MNQEVEQELERVQVHIDTVKEAIELADKLDVLSRVPEFDDIIMKGFMIDEPARIASIITDNNLLEDIDQRELLGAIKAVGYLGNYLRNIDRRGVQMRAALADAEAYKDELRNPDSEDE